MKYCKRCLYPENHPYGLVFDEHGVCSGCRVHEEKDLLDWNERFTRLSAIAEEIKRSSPSRGFNCIVPVTGGGDSYFTVHVVKNVLGLNPLLVNYNHHYNTKIGIRNLANLTTVFDCDLVQSTLSEAVVKAVTRVTLDAFGSMYWHVMAGQLTFPVQVAVRFNIPYIFWGVHHWSDQVGMYSHLDEVEMSERNRLEHPMMGMNWTDLLNIGKLKRTDLLHYKYPSDFEIQSVGVRGIYLSNYIRWDSKKQHEFMIEEYGYETSIQERTFNTYEDVHCHHSAGLHDYLKFLKLGYSKVTDHASREIRLRRMTRSQGVEMVRKYSEIVPSDIDLFCNWIELSKEALFEKVWNFRDTKIWRKKSDQDWELLDSVVNNRYLDINTFSLSIQEDTCDFKLTQNCENPADDMDYILMGRTYIDKGNFGSVENAPKGYSMTKRNWERPKLY